VREKYATPFLRELREAVGLRALDKTVVAVRQPSKPKGSRPMFKQYREADGRFYFKLVEGDRTLLVSKGFDSPREAGERIAALKRDGFSAADTTVALSEGVEIETVHQALARLREE